MKLLKRSEITYTISDECIETINELSKYFNVSESRIIEICIKYPNDFIRHIGALKEKDRIKKEADRIDKLIQGRLVQDEMYNLEATEDTASNVGESKWKDDDNGTEKNKEDTDTERQFVEKKYGFAPGPTVSSYGMQ